MPSPIIVGVALRDDDRAPLALAEARAAILAERAAELDLLVCGSRGYGAVRSVALGSVSRMLAHSASCPLVIVPRPPAEDATKLWRGHVRQAVTAHHGT